jgi:hypothetical protein
MIALTHPLEIFPMSALAISADINLYAPLPFRSRRMLMATATDGTRQAALSILSGKGLNWTRVGNGQRFIVEITRDNKTVSALVKTASYGGAMVSASSIGNDAVISGFDGDVDYVFFAVGSRDTGEVAAYLVPFDVAEKAYRATDRRSWHKDREAGAVWLLNFLGSGSKPGNGFAKKWHDYLIGTTDQREPLQVDRTEKENSPVIAPTKIAEVMAWARERIAEIAGARIDAVKLDLKIEY